MVEQNAKKGLEFADIGYVLVSGELAIAGSGCSSPSGRSLCCRWHSFTVAVMPPACALVGVDRPVEKTAAVRPSEPTQRLARASIPTMASAAGAA
jgi:hypothetical protein